MKKPRKIRTQLDKRFLDSDVRMSGWYDGKHTYLWFGEEDHCYAILSGAKLERLARRIVKEFDEHRQSLKLAGKRRK